MVEASTDGNKPGEKRKPTLAVAELEEEIKQDQGAAQPEILMQTSDTPAWMSRAKRRRENKELAKQMGVDKFRGGGFTQDKRWQKEKETDDGNLERVSFLKNLKLAPFAPLERMKERLPCPGCNKTCKYYCFQCFLPIGDLSAEMPKLDLPVKVTILSHPKEKKSKSSVVPAKILAPGQVDFVSAVDAPDFLADGSTSDQVAVLFPGDGATEVTSMSEEELRNLKRVIIIDSTWGQTKRYVMSENIKKLKMVKIQTEKTVFWRYQTGNIDSSLSSAEALYFFFRDYEVGLNCPGKDYSKYSGAWDNLLWFYAFNFKLIQDDYKAQNKEFRRIPGFIQKNSDSIFQNNAEAASQEQKEGDPKPEQESAEVIQAVEESKD